MIRQRVAATGAALAVFLILACRDAPTAPIAPVDSATVFSSEKEGLDALPGPARILSAYTEIGFYDGRRGGEPMAEFRVGMSYIANRASMVTAYSITGEGTSLSDRISNQQDSFYNPFLEKNWDEIYYVPTNRNCGLLIEANTQHGAWWLVWLRLIPNSESTRTYKFTLGTPLQIEPCEPEAPADDATPNDGGGTEGGWITIETCYYWAHYVNGALVSIELRYCTYDTIPIADE